METHISATELARGLGDVLGRIRYRGESFIVVRNGKPVARIGPIATRGSATVREAAAAWMEANPPAADEIPPAGGDNPPAAHEKPAGAPKGPAAEGIPQEIAQIMRSRGVVRAGMFGSVARDEATAVSDVDFLVEFEKGRTLLDLAGLRLDLEQELGRHVDVATPDSLHPALRDEIMRDLVPIL
ncbi:MAG: nucleotidyltransferase domain-containing protein [Gemmatimonadales bacterium]